ncbi:MAG TPA: dTDP-4-dehydrorhamnose reductase [Methylomirabilota bacterium]|nr:dTDP-4-dehydrorhamnose reductase [Methylomirabilota bacterium]
MTRIAVIGSSGQLGNDLVDAIRSTDDADVIPLSHSDIEVADEASVRSVLTAARPDIVVNCAAMVRVDDCEDHHEEAFRVNTLGALNVARTCAALSAVCVYISSDYVFDGKKQTPYAEDDLPRPLNVYGVSKVAGEHVTSAYCSRSYVVRSSGLYGLAGTSGKGGNFVETIIRLAREGKPIRVVNDQVLAPTYTKDLAQKIVQLLTTEAPNGLYHVTNAGQCSWFEFAGRIFALLSMEPDFAATTSAAYAVRAQRPAYSVLGRTRLAGLELDDTRSWDSALAAYLHEKGYL